MLNFLTTNKILKVQVTMQRSTFIVLIYLKRILRWIRKHHYLALRINSLTIIISILDFEAFLCQ